MSSCDLNLSEGCLKACTWAPKVPIRIGKSNIFFMGEIPIFYVDLEGVAGIPSRTPTIPSNAGPSGPMASAISTLAPCLVASCGLSVTLSGYHGLPMSFFQSNPKTVYGYSSVSLSHQLICPHGVHVTMLQHWFFQSGIPRFQMITEFRLGMWSFQMRWLRESHILLSLW